MNLKQSIVNLVRDEKKSLFSGNDVFTIIIKAFTHDYLIDHSAYKHYISLFGESTDELFRFMIINAEDLNDFIINYDGELLEADETSIYEFYQKNPVSSNKLNELAKEASLITEEEKIFEQSKDYINNLKKKFKEHGSSIHNFFLNNNMLKTLKIDKENLDKILLINNLSKAIEEKKRTK